MKLALLVSGIGVGAVAVGVTGAVIYKQVQTNRTNQSKISQIVQPAVEQIANQIESQSQDSTDTNTSATATTPSTTTETSTPKEEKPANNETAKNNNTNETNETTPEENTADTSPPPAATEPSLGAAQIAGDYFCISMIISGIEQACETSQTIHVDADGSWYFGSDVGTFSISGNTVTFASPYSGGTGWGSAGPADWGAAEYTDNALKFTSSDRITLWSK